MNAYTDVASAFDDLAAGRKKRPRTSGGYHRLIEAVHQAIVPAGASVLEIGSGDGSLLAAVQPARGVGVDVSGAMVRLAGERHPTLRFEHASGETVDLGETFDYILLSDVVPYVADLLALFQNVARHSHRDSR